MSNVTDVTFGPNKPTWEATEVSATAAKADKPTLLPTGMQVADAPKKAGKYDHVEKEKLFSLDDVDYFIPKEIPPSVVFSYLRDARRGGGEMAFANMFVELVGEDALDALAEHDGMTKENMKALMKALQSRVLGALELGN